MNGKVCVYLAKIPEGIALKNILPKQRADEVFSCRSAIVAKQKYYVWKLLEYALKQALNLPIETLDFKKTKSGKWQTSACRFSLAHSGKIVAVALSDSKVGVDVETHSEETLKKLKDLRFLTEREQRELAEICEEKKEAFFLEKWTAKESLFKAFGKGIFRPEKVPTENSPVSTRQVVAFGEKITVSVAGDGHCLTQWEIVTKDLG